MPSNQEARAAFAKFFEDYSARLACAIVTIRGVGFREAMVRTIAASVLTLLPRFAVGSLPCRRCLAVGSLPWRRLADVA